MSLDKSKGGEFNEELIGKIVKILQSDLNGEIDLLDCIEGHSIRLRLAKALEKLDSVVSVPDYVVETSLPFLSSQKSYTYEELMKLFEAAGLISRGVGKIWAGGGYVWEGNGMRTKEAIFGGFEGVLDRHGYEPFQLPSELPRVIIDTVNEGVVNLEEGTYWLSVLRKGELVESGLYANSSNDAAVSYYLANLARSGRRVLPFKGYSRHQIIRSHRDSTITKPMFNSDENYECFEAYSIEETQEGCSLEFERIVKIMQDYFDNLGVAYLTIDQSNWGNKPVATRVTSLQTFASQVGGSVRLATIYMHDDTFSKLFGLSTQREDGSTEFAHQVGYGLWEGLMIPLFDHLCDNHGLCVPPHIAAHQIAFIARDDSEVIKLNELESELDGLRIIVDTSYNKRFIKRLNKHRTNGVPIRITFNENGDKIIVSRRDTLQNIEITLEEFKSSIRMFLDSIAKNYIKRSREYLDDNVLWASDLDVVTDIVSRQKKLAVFNHCGTESCGKTIEGKLTGEFLGHVREYSASGCCIECKQTATNVGLFGRRAPTP